MINFILASLVTIGAINFSVRSQSEEVSRNEYKKTFHHSKVAFVKEEQLESLSTSSDSHDNEMLSQLKTAYLNIHPNLFTSNGQIKENLTSSEHLILEKYNEEQELIKRIYGI